MNPSGIPQPQVLLLSLLVPLVAGFIVTRIRQDDMATVAFWYQQGQPKRFAA